MALHWGASAFGATLNEVWSNMPPLSAVREKLQEWGIGGDELSDAEAQHRYARFEGVDFGVAPRCMWG